jgi:hypothetical protein
MHFYIKELTLDGTTIYFSAEIICTKLANEKMLKFLFHSPT